MLYIELAFYRAYCAYRDSPILTEDVNIISIIDADIICADMINLVCFSIFHNSLLLKF